MTKPTGARHVQYSMRSISIHAMNLICIGITYANFFHPFSYNFLSILFYLMKCLPSSTSSKCEPGQTVYRFGCLGCTFKVRASYWKLEPTKSGENGQTIRCVCRAWYGAKSALDHQNQGEAAVDCLNQVIEEDRYMQGSTVGLVSGIPIPEISWSWTYCNYQMYVPPNFKSKVNLWLTLTGALCTLHLLWNARRRPRRSPPIVAGPSLKHLGNPWC